MGKGDKKTKRGKIIMGSYGVRRPRKVAKEGASIEKSIEDKEVQKPKVSEAPKKAVAKKTSNKKSIEAKK